jgi:hypothetical protein
LRGQIFEPALPSAIFKDGDDDSGSTRSGEPRAKNDSDADPESFKFQQAPPSANSFKMMADFTVFTLINPEPELTQYIR